MSSARATPTRSDDTEPQDDDAEWISRVEDNIATTLAELELELEPEPETLNSAPAGPVQVMGDESVDVDPVADRQKQLMAKAAYWMELDDKRKAQADERKREPEPELEPEPEPEPEPVMIRRQQHNIIMLTFVLLVGLTTFWLEPWRLLPVRKRRLAQWFAALFAMIRARYQ